MMRVLAHSPPFCSALRTLDPWPFRNIIRFPYALWRKLIALMYSFTFLSTPAFLKPLPAFRWLKATFSGHFVSQTMLMSNSKGYVNNKYFYLFFIYLYLFLKK